MTTNKPSLQQMEWMTVDEPDFFRPTPAEREWIKQAEGFSEMMTRTGVFARLAEQCGRYIGRFNNADREAVLACALELAWQFSDDFDPEKKNLTMWWDSHLQYALGTRPAWECRMRHGWVTVRTEDVPGLSEYDLGDET